MIIDQTDTTEPPLNRRLVELVSLVTIVILAAFTIYPTLDKPEDRQPHLSADDAL